jgi:hypothetical protein
MHAAIGYLRVSTHEQGRRGFSLETQRRDIEAFGAREGFAARWWYQDVQTGGGTDALQLRPGLAAALKDARLRRRTRQGLRPLRTACLRVASGARAEADFRAQQDCCRSAEAPRKAIRVRDALEGQRHRISAMGRAAKTKAANERAEAYRLHIEWALRQPGLRGKKISLNRAADMLNARNIESPRGGSWTGTQMQVMAIRLGIYHPLSFLRWEVARAKVRALWRRHPDLSAGRAAVRLGLGICRAEWLMRECRLAAARRDPTYKRIGWHLDRFTAARLRIAAIWRRHPELTAGEIRQKLRPRYYLRLEWVQQVLRECWRPHAKPRHPMLPRPYAPWRFRGRARACR